jgi:hypothetical protein
VISAIETRTGARYGGGDFKNDEPPITGPKPAGHQEQGETNV